MYDLVVIGGGAGGTSVAKEAAKLGASVALIERSRLGGECALTACVPSKALLRAAALAADIRQAGRFGIHAEGPRVDFGAVMGRVRALVEGFASGKEERLEHRGIDVLHGDAAFEAYDTILLDGSKRVSGRRFVIATGSRTAWPSVPGLKDSGAIDNGTVWGLNELPESLAILGGGPSGLEFAQAFARLGSSVTVLETNDRVLAKEDPDASAAIAAALEAEGVTIRTGVRVAGVATRDGRKVVTYRDRVGAEPATLDVSHLLVATGRRANVDGLNLNAVGIHADPEHGINVDDSLQTHAPNIYAIGDVIGHHQWTHAAGREATVVVRNALLRMGKKMTYDTIPRVVFTDPEVACVGATEDAARQAEPDAQLYRVELEKVDRARLDGATTGFARVMVTPAGRVLGATIVAREASSILQELVVAMTHRLTLADLAETVHPYPSYLGVAQALAGQFAGAKQKGGLLGGARRWFYGLGSAEREGRTTSTETEPAEAGAGHGH